MRPVKENAAIRKGMRAAMRLQRDLKLDKGDHRRRRIDVFECINRCGATLMFQPLDPLVGAFIREGTAAGILLSTRRPLGQQRFTAAHELGHLQLGHDPHADDEGILRRSPIAGRNGFPETTSEEREADAFASYFLLPVWLIKEQMAVHGWTQSDFAAPEIVYQASLRFGTSYSGTLYGLEREKVIDCRLRRELLRVQPRTLKRALLPDYPLQTTQGVDVWHLTERDEGAVIEAGRDDLFLLRLREDSGAGYVWTFDELQAAGFAILRDGREPVSAGRIGAPTIRRVLARSDQPLSGTYHLQECRPWAPDDEPRALTLHCSTATSDQSGLFRPQLDELLAAS